MNGMINNKHGKECHANEPTHSTTIVLPNQGKRKNSTILLNHKGEEMSTTVKPLFPYTWNGSWYVYKRMIPHDANIGGRLI